MKTLRWFAIAGSIAAFQWWGWTRAAKSDGYWIGWPDFWFSFAVVAGIMWFSWPQGRPLGFQRGPEGRDRVLAWVERRLDRF